MTCYCESIFVAEIDFFFFFPNLHHNFYLFLERELRLLEFSRCKINVFFKILFPDADLQVP